MQKNTKQAFTLVELIVSIIILSILGTISFISFQGYNKRARDSVRISDINNIEKALEIYSIKVGKYITPENPTDIYYAGDLMWSQGVFGDELFNRVGTLSKIPLDPLLEAPYAYSVTNNRKAYEIVGILEDQYTSGIIPQANAAGNTEAIVKGTYNGMVLKTQNYIVATPSLVLGQGDIQLTGADVTLSGATSIVPNSSRNVPVTTTKIEVTEDDKFIFNYGDPDVLLEDNKNVGNNKVNTTSDPKTFVENMGELYSNYPDLLTNTSDIGILNKLFEAGTSSGAEIIERQRLMVHGVDIINNYLGGKIVLEGCEIDGQSFESGEQMEAYEKNFYTFTEQENGDVVSITRTCLGGLLDGDAGYTYLNPTIAGALSCNSTIDISGHTYEVDISHGTSTITSNPYVISNGVAEIDQEFTCYDGGLTYEINETNQTAIECGTDYYSADGSTCEAVGIGNYSPSSDITITACTNKPFNSDYTTDGNGTNNCTWSCNINYTETGNSCIADTQIYTCLSKPSNSTWNTVPNYTQTWDGNTWLPANSTTSYDIIASTTTCRFKCDTGYTWNGTICSADGCSANTQTINTHIYNVPELISGGTTNVTSTAYSITNGKATMNQTFNCSLGVLTTNGEENTLSVTECGIDYYSADGITCEAAGTGYYSTSTDITRTACTNKPLNSIYTGDGNGTNNCTWSCNTNYTESGNNCIADTKTYSCSTKPSTGTVWNIVPSYTQTWSGTTWLPADSTTTYNTTSSTTTCRYKCDTGYTWNGTICEVSGCPASTQTINTHTYNVPELSSGGTTNITSTEYIISNGKATMNQTFNCSLGVLTTSGAENTLTLTECATDYYTSNGTTCVAVGTGYYSTSTAKTRTACSNYPDTASRNYTYTSDGNGTNSCTATYAGLCGVDKYETSNGVCSDVGTGYYSANLNNGRTSCSNYPDTASRNYTYTSDGNGTNSCTASYTALCGVDKYETSNGVCSNVGTGYYSANLNNGRTACTNKPSYSVYTTDGNGTNNCSFSCNSGRSLIGGACTLNTWVSGSRGSCSATAVWVASARNGCSVPCGPGYRTRSVTCPAKTGSQTLSYVCKNSSGTIISNSLCTSTKPVTTRSCTDTVCNATKPPTIDYNVACILRYTCTRSDPIAGGSCSSGSARSPGSACYEGYGAIYRSYVKACQYQVCN